MALHSGDLLIVPSRTVGCTARSAHSNAAESGSPRRTRRTRWAVVVGLATLAAVVVFASWYRPGQIILFWDQTFPLSPALDIRTAASLWHIGSGFGQENGTSFALLPYFGLVWLLEAALRSASLAQATLYFMILSSSLIGFYVLAMFLLERACAQAVRWPVHAAALLASVFYTFNPYSIFFEWRIVNSVVFLQALLPWWLLALLWWTSPSGRERVIGQSLVMFGLVTVAMSPGLSNPGMLPVVLVIAATILVHRAPHVALGRLAVACVLFLASDAFALVPLLSSVTASVREASYGGTLSALLQNSGGLTPLNVLRLIGTLPITETYRGEPDYPWAYIYAGRGWWALFTALPLIPLGLAGAGLWRRRCWKNHRVVAVVVAAIALLLAAEGTNGPTGALFLFVFLHVHLFQAYRDPFSEFGFGAMTLLALLLGFGILAWTSNRSVGIMPAWVGPAAYVAALLAIGGFAWPMFSGAVFRSAGPVRPGAYVAMPRSLGRVARLLQRDDRSDAAVLTFPQELTPLQSGRWVAGYVGFDPLVSLTERPQISTLLSGTGESQAVAVLYKDFALAPARALVQARDLGVRYLLFRWDNNYRFGGVGSPEGLKQLSIAIRATGQVRVVFSSARDMLLYIGGRRGTRAVGASALLGSGNSAAVPAEAGRSVVLPSLESGAANGAVAAFAQARLDVGSPQLRVYPHSNSVALSIVGPAEGSVRVPLSLRPSVRFLVLRVSGSGGAVVSVAASQYTGGQFVVGGYLSLVNPSPEGGLSVRLHGPATLVYALSALTFRPNVLNIHLTGTPRRQADMVVSQVLGLASLPVFHGPSTMEVHSVPGGRSPTIGSYYAPWLASLSNTNYSLSLSFNTGTSQMYVAGAMVTNGVYQYGAPLKVVSVVGRGASSAGGLIEAPDGGVAYLQAGSVRPYNTMYLVLTGGSPAYGTVRVSKLQMVKQVPGIATDVTSLSTRFGAVMPIGGNRMVPLLMLPRVGEVVVRAAELTSPTVAVVLPEDFASGWQLQVRVGGGRWRVASADHVVADGFLDSWVWAPRQVLGPHGNNYGSLPRVELRAEFVDQSVVGQGLLVSGAGLLLSVLLALGACWRERGSHLFANRGPSRRSRPGGPRQDRGRT